MSLDPAPSDQPPAKPPVGLVMPYDSPVFGKTAAAVGPLSEAHLAQLDQAGKRLQKLRRTTTAATVDAWVTALFAASALITGWMGIDQLLIGLALAAVAYNSFRGAARLKRLDPSALRLLSLNQLFLAAAIILYSLYEIWVIRNGRSQLVGMIVGGPEDAELAAGAGVDIKGLQQTIIYCAYAIYFSLIAGTLIFQGLTALYYARRERHLHEYLAETPPWIVEIQRKTAVR